MNIRIRFSIVLVAISFLMFAPRTYAQGDTVHFRLLTDMLNDSTQIGYEIGAVGYKHDGTLRYLQFYPTSVTVDSFFLTKPFVVASSLDSLVFCRFGVMDDKNFRSIDALDTTTNPVDSFYQDILSHYDSNWAVHTATTAFDEYSSAYFIVEARSFPSNSLIARLDTVKFYRNGSGNLRWYNRPDDYHSTREMHIPSSMEGDTIAIGVSVTFNLPSGASIINSERQMYIRNLPCDVGDYSYAGQDVTSPMPALSVSASTGLFDITINPNPASKHFEINYAVVRSGTVDFQFLSVLGQQLMNKKVSAAVGTGKVDFDCSEFPAGKYFVRISSNGVVGSYPVSIIK